MTAAAEFKAARASLGLTQADMARVLHCHTHYISNVEQGRRVPSLTLRELLRAVVAGYRPVGYPSS